MRKCVGPDGRLDSRIVLIGEAPGTYEVQRGKPFVGPSGSVLSHWWSLVGLRRGDFYIDNVIHYQAPRSNIALMDKDEVEMWAGTLHERILTPTDPIIIVPTGNIALRALLRKPLWGNTSPKIGDWRGSIFHVTLNDGRKVKCIPTYHPAATFKDPSLSKICLEDWERIAGDVQFRGVYHPQWTHIIPPESSRSFTLDRYREVVRDKRTVLSIDIECPGKRMACVGFSYIVAEEERRSPRPPKVTGESLVLQWPQQYEEIKELCESPCIKVLQNGLFDQWWMWPPSGLADLSVRHWGMKRLPRVRVGGTVFDLLAMSHAIDATMPHDLATMASRYTRQPYWKRSWKGDGEATSDKEPFDRLCLYNGIDDCVERYLYDTFVRKLAR